MERTKILIIAGGGIKHLGVFKNEARKLKLSLTIASFRDLNYKTSEKKTILKIKNTPINNFDVVYIRLVGKQKEENAVLVDYCKEKKIKVIDRAFLKKISNRIPYPKAIETRLLDAAGVPVPKTFFGNVDEIFEKAPKIFGYPFVIKGTTGKQGHAVWSPRSKRSLPEIRKKVETAVEKDKDMKFIAQEFIKASQRDRVFVVGGKVLAAITRPTRWRRRFIEKVEGEYPEGIRRPLEPIPESDAKLAIKAAEALYVDIAGVDIITDDIIGKKYVLEVNSAPRWESIKSDTGINVEREILKFLGSL